MRDLTKPEAITLEDHYTNSAWANGDAALQAGRWPHIELMLDSAEPGIKTEVMARLTRLRRDQKMKARND